MCHAHHLYGCPTGNVLLLRLLLCGHQVAQALARNITTLQLTQMFVNLALLSSICYTCGPKHHVSFWPTAAMSTCYACLFMDLYRQRYSRKRKEQSEVPQHTEGGLHAAPVYPPWAFAHSGTVVSAMLATVPRICFSS